MFLPVQVLVKQSANGAAGSWAFSLVARCCGWRPILAGYRGSMAVAHRQQGPITDCRPAVDRFTTRRPAPHDAPRGEILACGTCLFHNARSVTAKILTVSGGCHARVTSPGASRRSGCGSWDERVHAARTAGEGGG